LRLDLAAAELDAALAEQASRNAPRVEAPRDAEAASTRLAERIAQPSLDPAWQADVAASLPVLGEDGIGAADRALVGALGRAIAHQVSTVDGPRQLPRALELVRFGLEHAPESEPLLAQQ